jgi:hypothetical protein
MKRRISLVIAPVVIALLSLTFDCRPDGEYGTRTLSLTKTLSVRLVSQQAGYWCWAASGQMVMAFLGHDTSQCQQVVARWDRSDCCPAPGAAGCDVGGWPQFGRYGFAAESTEHEPLSWEAVKAEIDAGRPVAFSWEWRYGGGHMMVLIGYEQRPEASLVQVNDPRPSTPLRPWVTYGEYVADSVYTAGEDLRHKHWNDYYAITYVGASASPAPGGTGPGASATGPVAPQEPSYPSPAAAAESALKLLLKSPALSGSLLPGVTLAGLAVSAGLPDYIVRLDSLRTYTAAKDPMMLLVKMGRVAFPVQKHNTVYTSITVRRSETGWRLASYGAYDLRHVPTSSLGTAAAAGQAILVEVPALHGIAFLGTLSGGLRLVVLTTDAELGLVGGQPVANVAALFAQLATAAKRDTTHTPH